MAMNATAATRGPFRGGGQVTTTQILPDFDRAAIVFWLGAPLILVNFAENNFGVGAMLGASGLAPKGRGETVTDLVLQGGMLGILILLARYAGDAAGSFAVVFLVALWVLFVLRHASGIGGFVAAGGTPSAASTSKKG